MDAHFGSCRKLIEALNELMPDKFDFDSHHSAGPDDDECFRITIANLIRQAVLESDFAKTYAIACQQIAELFEPVHGESATEKNQFKYLVTNQCQLIFSRIR